MQMPHRQLPSFCVGIPESTVKDTLPKEYKGIHVCTPEQRHKTEKKWCLGKTSSLGFPLFLNGGPFFVQNTFCFPTRTSCSTSCGNAKGWVCGPQSLHSRTAQHPALMLGRQGPCSTPG